MQLLQAFRDKAPISDAASDDSDLPLHDYYLTLHLASYILKQYAQPVLKMQVSVVREQANVS